nr:response regulator [Actinacidiphila yeochonensis]
MRHTAWPDAEQSQARLGPAQWPAPADQAAPHGPALPGGGGGRVQQGYQDPHGQHSQHGQQGMPDPSLQSHGRAISVRALGQGTPPFGGDPGEQTPTQAAQAQHPNGLPAQVAAGGSGRRRRLAAPQDGPSVSALPLVPSQPGAQTGAQTASQAGVRVGQPGPQPGAQPVAPAGTQPADRPGAPGSDREARQHPQADPDSGQLPVRRTGTPSDVPSGTAPETASTRPVPAEPGPRAQGGRAYAIGAPAAGAAEGPEPLDGPNGAIDVTDTMGHEPVGSHGPHPRVGFGPAVGPGAVPDVRDAADDHPDIPLDEPRRLLVWPEPDVSTRQALTDRGYRPVTVRSREEVDAQVAEPPAALFVDPLTGPITRTALQSLRQAAAAAEVPVLVTAGLGQATREAAYGADPAVLLKALAPRDSDQHPPRVLLVEGHDPIADAFSATLERRGMQVTHADSESDAMTKAAQVHPNLVVMDLMLIRRRRQGIVDWLRGNSRLNSTPLVVYTSADIDPDQLSRLASGETVLFLAERSTSPDVQSRIVDLLGKIGA